MSDHPALLNSVEIPLDGMNLVEAAAGTGKTYNIQNLVVRLILEKSMKISEIAVLSYTKEAAAELAKRIRNILEAISAELENVPGEKNEQAGSLLTHDRAVRPESSDDDRLKAVRNALQDFDLANISTINGFCQKLIQRFAFESRNSFGAELECDPTQHIRNICNDWLRGKCYESEKSELFSALMPLKTIYDLQSHILDFNLIVPPGNDSFDKLSDALEVLFTKFADGQALSVLRGGRLRSNSKVHTRLDGFEKAIKLRDVNTVLNLIEIYLPESICGAALKSFYAVISAEVATGKIFQLLKRIFKLKKSAVAALKSEAISFIRQRFAEAEVRGNFMTYSDQIRIVDKALAEVPEYKEILRSKFKAGIIDEFQDTDTMQYRIFKALFEGEGRCVFLVGDPRQAIYRFRGGDINAYLAVKAEASAHGMVYRLGVNYRSSVKMVEGVNRIFAVHPHPFGSVKIDFPPLGSRPVEKAPELLVNGTPAENALLRIVLPQRENNDPLPYAALRIAQLLSPDAPERLPDGSPLTPGDIAVLMYSNPECFEMRRMLEKLNIPAVCLKSGNVFASSEAADLYTVMDAALEPGDRRKINAALASGLCDLPLEQLIKNETSAIRLTGFSKIFKTMNELWLKGGFAAMLEYFMREFHVREKLASRPDGERALTNLFQLEELIQHEALFGQCSTEALLGYLGNMIARSNERVEEHEELMSTDGSSVRIMTVHGSKGLQFPVVILPAPQKFVPSFWMYSNIFFNGTARELNINDDLEKRELEYQELYDEFCRLIYVAVTRAEYRCEVFEPPEDSKAVWKDLMAFCDLEKYEFPKSNAALFQQKAVEFVDALPEFPEKTPDWQVSSFTSLTDGVSISPQDHDENEELDLLPAADAPAVKEIFSPFALSGGTGFGNLFHEFAEKIDFAGAQHIFTAAARNIIRHTGEVTAEDHDVYTAEYGRWLRDIFHSPLEDFNGETFMLSEIAAADRICEMEFCFGLQNFSLSALGETLKEYLENEFSGAVFPDNWSESIPEGVLTGFIDLIFRRDGRYYIVDWKTNRLDGKKENFMPHKLPSAMAHSLYFLQYLIYMVALVRHLRKFNQGVFGEAEYESVIGGVYYLFVRGIAPDSPGCGIFRSRPPWQLIRQLEEILCPDKI